MSNLLVRTLTSIVFAAAVIFFTFLGRMEMSVLFGAFAIIAFWEFLSFPRVKPIPLFVKLLSLGAATLVYMTVSHVLIGLMNWQWLMWCLLLTPAYLIIALYSKNDPITISGVPLLGLVYIVMPFSLLADLGTHHDLYIFELILFPLFMIWIYDSGAYLVGSKFGKHRLFESVSPKKSWEGAIGGAILTLGSSFLFAFLNQHYSQIEWLMVSLIVIVFGTIGDLAESKMKRHFDVKDSGKILPGHGGLLDRFDAWILIIPPLYVFKTLVLS